jgi:Fe-S cluster biogenesis protein NfuA
MATPSGPPNANPRNGGQAFTQQEQMRGLIDQLSAYIQHYHGGSVELVSFDGSTLRVRLGGACTGCPLSLNTLHGWVEGTVRQFFPQIEKVEAVP